MSTRCSCGAIGKSSVHEPGCTWDTQPPRVAVFEPLRTMQDSPVIADTDLEFQVLIRCVSELNRLIAVDKKAAMRVADYLFQRFGGK